MHIDQDAGPGMFEIPDTIRHPFQYFDLIIKSFGWPIGEVGILECIQNLPAPVAVGGCICLNL